MKIDMVQISNFKSLKDITIELKDLTLITGVNSSGKSSFIQALLLLKQNQNTINQIDIFNKLFKVLENKEKKQLSQPNEYLDIEGEYLNLGNRKELLYQEAYDENVAINLYSEERSLEVSFNQDLKVDIKSNKAIIRNSFNLFYDDFQYLTTDRVSPAVTYALSDSSVKHNIIGTKGEYTAHYLSEKRHNALKIKTLKHKDSKTDQLLENVSLWLSDISKGIEVKAKLYPEIQQVNLTYSYTYGNETTNDYTPLNVGFGLTYALPIIVSILKSKPGDLLIIENPESHLHPSGQAKIAELCAIASSCGVQIIVETHSDHFLNGIRVATKKNIITPEHSQIYYFRKEDNNLETKLDIIKIDKEGGIDKWPAGFFDEYRNKLDELLW